MFRFPERPLGRVRGSVFPVGLSASYRPGQRTIFEAADRGVNYFFCFGIDSQMIGALRELLPGRREQYVVATGAYNYLWGYQNLRKTLEKRLRQLKTDYIDLFHILGVPRARHFSQQAKDDLLALREDPRVKGVSISTHDRKLAGELAAAGTLDALMVRYNAAHRGAEQEIFPYVRNGYPAIVSFTATRWTRLIRRTRGWPAGGPVPTAGLCYRFVLSNPHVDVCMMAPANVNQLRANLAEIEKGPLDLEEMAFVRGYGDAVHAHQHWFM